MSFANRWLDYLQRKNRTISHIALIGERPEDMPHTQISITHTGTKVEQAYFSGEELRRYSMGIPDKIGIKPLDVESVKIKTGTLTFCISKDETGKNLMKIKHLTAQKDLSAEEEEELIKDAKELGYNVVEFGQSST